MPRRLLLVVLLLVCACHKHRATKELFGVKVTPPGVLAKIRPGMTVAELKALVPDMKNDPGKGYLLEEPASNVKLYAIVMDDAVVDTYIDLVDDHALDLVTAAWGPPDAEKARTDPDEIAWRSTTTGWRASVFCGHGTATTPLPPFCTITLHPHKPLEQMFGKALAPPGELATTKPGTPRAQVAATAHVTIVKDAQVIRTLDYDGATELISIMDGKLYSLSYSLPALARPMIEAAWGPGTSDKEDGTDWFDAKTGWCARLTLRSDKSTLDLNFVSYMPFEAQIDLFDAMSKGSLADMKKAHPELCDVKDGEPTRQRLKLPVHELVSRLELGASYVTASAFSRTSGTLFATSADGDALPSILASFTKRWGTPKKKIDGDTTRYEWSNHNYVGLFDDQVSIQIGPP
jgi:hypothetical protein